MTEHLVLTIRLHDQRYHGASEWPPAPARVFQALLAGAAQGNRIPEETQRALLWLEEQPAPLVAAPHACEGQRISSFVPNNDADSIGGDPSRVEEIRAQKSIAPQLIASDAPFVYAWPLLDATVHGDIEATAEKLYQFGRGVDMAWARVEVMGEDAFASFLSAHRGTVHRPAPGGDGNALACPTPGSFQSLVVRHQATIRRLRMDGEGRSASCLFVQPPKPRFVQVVYDSPIPSRVFELVRAGTEISHPWRLGEVVRLVEYVREAVVRRLRDALPGLEDVIRASLVGRKPGEASSVQATQRVRIVPLPSIGHEHADRAIRRVLVEVPRGCPLSPEDVFWAFSGQSFDAATGEVASFTLIPKHDDNMRPRYERASLGFRSITPVAVPESAKRRRIDPARKREERKPASERINEEERAVGAVRIALRHAGVRVPPSAIAVQREPLEAKGGRAEEFSSGTRFPKERLWHVEIQFAEPVSGPLVIGDGRFLGLGVMVPVSDDVGVRALGIQAGLVEGTAPEDVAGALRRAVMARVGNLKVAQQLPPFFSGHETNGAPARSERSPHLTFMFDPGRRRLLVVPPHVAERRSATRAEQAQLALLDRALVELVEIRAGAAGVLRVQPALLDMDADCLFRGCRSWESVTDYQVTRHEKKVGAHAALTRDLQLECRRRGLPEPSVTVVEAHGVRGEGLVGRAKLNFPVAVRGPIMLGRSRHLGGGLFAATCE